MRWVLIALLAATPCSAANMPSPNWPAPADRGPELLRNAVLNAHNAARRHFGVDAQSIVVAALAQLARRGEVKASAVKEARERYGL